MKAGRRRFASVPRTRAHHDRFREANLPRYLENLIYEWFLCCKLTSISRGGLDEKIGALHDWGRC